MEGFAPRRRNIAVGLLVLVVIAGIFYLIKSRADSMKVPESSNEPTITQIEQNFKDKYNITIPDDVEKTSLKDVSGGPGAGIATRTEILADLPDPEEGTFYQAWLQNGDKVISLGKMSMEKGGWLISYNSSAYPEYNSIVVSLEKVFDSNLEKRILEGSF